MTASKILAEVAIYNFRVRCIPPRETRWKTTAYSCWFKPNVFVHRNHKVHKQVQETRNHKVHKQVQETRNRKLHKQVQETRNRKLHKQVQETQKQYACLSVTCR